MALLTEDLSFDLLSFLSSTIPSRTPHCIQLSRLLRLLLAVTVSDFPFVTLAVVRGTGQGYLLQDLPFLGVTGLMAFREEGHRGRMPLFHVTPRVRYQHGS